MKIKASLKYLRISPRKVRLITNLVKGMDVEEAKIRLQMLVQRAAKPLLKLLNSAIASAKHDFDLEEKNLYISKINTNPGPTLKRWRARARGVAAPIGKRTSHVILELTEKSPSAKTKAKVRPEAVGEEVRKPSTKKFVETTPKVTKTKPLRVAKPKIVRKPKKKELLGKIKFRQIGKKIFRRKSI